jgi:hypothetical protein
MKQILRRKSLKKLQFLAPKNLSGRIWSKREFSVLEDVEEFVIMDESKCDIDFTTKVNRKEKLTLDFASKVRINVFFSPMPCTAEEMKKKIVFREKYVKDTIKENEYRRRKKTFELNKMGYINLIQHENVNKK